MTDASEAIEKIRDLRDVQGQNGTWNASGYMRGLYNGLELALSVLEGYREPVYREPPDGDYLCDREPADMSGPEYAPVPGDAAPSVADDVFDRLMEQFLCGESVITFPDGVVNYSAVSNDLGDEFTLTLTLSDGSTVSQTRSLKP